ncbi:MAG: hypothetical protein Q9181_001999 [Wetmoreana brouardii]
MSWKDIYGQRKGHATFVKSNFYDGSNFTNQAHSVVSERDPAKHAEMRKYLSNAFSDRSLKEQEYLISGTEHSWISTVLGSMGQASLGDTLTRFPLLARIWMRLNSNWAKALAEDSARHESYTLDLIEKRVNERTSRKDYMSHLIQDQAVKQLSIVQLAAHASDFVIAGSETTATTLTVATYFLCRYPLVLQKLQTEVRMTFTKYEQINGASAANLKYLHAVCLEALRVFPPLPLALPRVVPPGGDTVDGCFVPEESPNKRIIASIDFNGIQRHDELQYPEGKHSLAFWKSRVESLIPEIGGSSGIGLATAHLLSSRGATVHILDRDEPSIKTLENYPKSSKNGTLTFHSCELTSWSLLLDIFTEIGHVDIVVANAGVSEECDYFADEFTGTGDLAEPAYSVIDVSLKATLNVVKLALRAFRMQWAGRRDEQIGLIRALRPKLPRAEFGGSTINAVAPAATVTALLPADLAAPIRAAGLPVSTAHHVALAIVWSATARQAWQVEGYGKDSRAVVESEGRWNGRVILTLGDRWTEVEEPHATLRNQWMGKWNADMTALQQVATDVREVA